MVFLDMASDNEKASRGSTGSLLSIVVGGGAATQWGLSGVTPATWRRMLRSMAIPHAQPGQPIEANGFPVPNEATQSTALFKSKDLEVIRLVLAAGKSLPPHRVAGDITIHCLSGLIEVGYGDVRPQLLAGQMVFLPGGALHDVQALSDARALVTIALRPAARLPAA